MKSFWIIVLIFTTWVFLSSCTKQIYSHWQVMQSYHTKADVMRQFGQPDEVMIMTDTTEWLYNFSYESHFDSTNTKVKINGVHNGSRDVTFVPANVKQFSNYNKFVLFKFNKDDRVLSWQSSRMNFAQRKIKVFPTVALGLFSILIVMGTIFWINFFTWFSNRN